MKYNFLFQSSVRVTQIHVVINSPACRCMGVVQGLQPITHVLVKERITIAQIVRETEQKMKFSIKDFFSKSDKMRRKLKFLMQNFIFCAVRTRNLFKFVKNKARKGQPFNVCCPLNGHTY